MKICQIVASSGNGGLEKHVRELCNEMSMREDVTLIAPQDMHAGINDSVKFIPFDFSRSRHNPFLLWDLLKLLRLGEFDIVHAQANKAAGLLAAVRKGQKAKTLGTVHNYKNKVAAFEKLDGVIAVSQGLKSQFKANKPVFVVYNGLTDVDIGPEIDRLQLCREYSLDADKHLLCCVGRLVEAKGFDLLIEAISGLDLNLLIIGDGPLQPVLQQQIERLGLGQQIKMIGYRADVRSVLKLVDGLVIPSRREGFSYVFAEALISGCPVLATDVPICNEFLPTALIVKKSAESLNKELAELLAKPEKWRELMVPVFAKAEQELTISAMTQQTLDVYKRIVTKA